MIWLSPTAGPEECSVYFEIRDVEFRRTGWLTEGVIRGVLGDGQRELWGEVHLGPAPRVQILPTWSEEGEEGFAVDVDESLLEQQLLAAVEKLICRFTAIVRTEEELLLLPEAAVARRRDSLVLAA